MRLKSSEGAVLRLRGRQFAEPREPRELRSGRIKRKDASESGHDADAQAYMDNRLDAEVGELIARTEIDYGKPIAAADRVGADAAERREDALREVEERSETETQLEAKEEELGERPSPSRLVLLFTKALLFLISLPIDVEAAHALPLAPAMQTVLAITIGAGMVVAADWAGKKLEDLHQAYLAREQDGFEFKQQWWLLGVAIGVPLFVVVGTTLLRAQAFTSEERLTGGIVQGGAANIAFAALTLMAFTVALLMSFAHRRALPLREVRSERKKNRTEREHWQAVADTTERIERQAVLTVAWLEQSRAQRIKNIEYWGERRKAATRFAASARTAVSAHSGANRSSDANLRGLSATQFNRRPAAEGPARSNDTSTPTRRAGGGIGGVR